MRPTKQSIFLSFVALSTVLLPQVAKAGVVCKPGVLISQTCSDWSFWRYVSELLGSNGIGVYVLFTAIIMIVFSGVEYMMGATSDGQKKAKERIRGILIGVAFYAIVLVALGLISSRI